MNLKQFFIVLVCIPITQNIACMNPFIKNNKENQEIQSCPLLIRNTSGSPIWISQGLPLDKNMTIGELEQSQAQVIAPYDIGQVQVGKTFTMHTRMPQSNANYQQSLTVVQRLCDPDNDEYVVDSSLFETGQADPARFIVINHTQEKDVPESAYPICPGGLLPELDEETDQWLCKVYRYSDAYEKFVDEYVPVLSYIYQYLPISIWLPWYIKNPQFYNWYHQYPELYSHMEQYIAPWQTKEYEAWYNAQPAKTRNSVRTPEFIGTPSYTTSNSKQSPMGLPESKIKSKNKSAHQAQQELTTPAIVVHSKERKKQKLEDIISSENIFEQSPEIKQEEKKKIVQELPQLKYYDRKTKQKPMALNKRYVIKTQLGDVRVAL